MSNRVFTPEMLKHAEQKVNSPLVRLIRGEDKATGSTVLMGLHKNGSVTLLAEHIILERKPEGPCECSIEHSVGKLGHCRDCRWYKPDQQTAVDPGLLRGAIGCPPQHVDGTPHIFTWATYADAQTSTGVCRCGLHDMDVSIWYLP